MEFINKNDLIINKKLYLVFEIKTIEKATVNWDNTVVIAAPLIPSFGINIKFNVILIIAPINVIKNDIFV